MGTATSKIKLGVLLFWVDESLSGINESSLKKVEAQLKNAQGEKLYLVLHTSGGDPFSAVRIMRVIQKKFKTIIAIVPSHSLSAGTLMAIGANEIYMQPKSMLGPLDLPNEHPADGSTISALDFKNTVTTIAGLSDTIASDRYLFLRKVCRISKKEAATLALETATKFVEPIVQKVDPYHLQKSVRELKIGWFYAYDLLLSRMMKEASKQAWDTAKTLVNSFPSHDYGIFSDDAINMLKLEIKDLDNLNEWSAIKPIYDVVNKLRKDAILYKEVDYVVQTTK